MQYYYGEPARYYAGTYVVIGKDGYIDSFGSFGVSYSYEEVKMAMQLLIMPAEKTVVREIDDYVKVMREVTHDYTVGSRLVYFKEVINADKSTTYYKIECEPNTIH